MAKVYKPLTQTSPTKERRLRQIRLKHRITPQAALVLDYLTTKRTLTPLIASTSLGVASVSARIAELRRAGVHIKTTFEEDHLSRRYGKYELE